MTKQTCLYLLDVDPDYYKVGLATLPDLNRIQEHKKSFPNLSVQASHLYAGTSKKILRVLESNLKVFATKVAELPEAYQKVDGKTELIKKQFAEKLFAHIGFFEEHHCLQKVPLKLKKAPQKQRTVEKDQEERREIPLKMNFEGTTLVLDEATQLQVKILNHFINFLREHGIKTREKLQLRPKDVGLPHTQEGYIILCNEVNRFSVQNHKVTLDDGRSGFGLIISGTSSLSKSEFVKKTLAQLEPGLYVKADFVLGDFHEFLINTKEVVCKKEISQEELAQKMPHWEKKQKDFIDWDDEKNGIQLVIM